MRTPTTSEVAGAVMPRWNRLVVGFDGSPVGRQAVEWAAAEAAVRGASLGLVGCSVASPAVGDDGVGADRCPELTAVVAAVRRGHPDLEIVAISTNLDPLDALLDAASEADLLVVGATTSGVAGRWLLASVPRRAVRHSACPVVVVRGRAPRPLRRIAVGIDGSGASASALEWAVDEADRHEAELLIVHAWLPTGEVGRSMRARDLARSNAQCGVDLAVTRCRARTNAAVDGRLIEGDVSAVLASASDDADLVVVGSRGRSGFKTLLFGSAALSAVEHANCPVAVIHPRLPTSGSAPDRSESVGPRRTT